MEMTQQTTSGLHPRALHLCPDANLQSTKLPSILLLLTPFLCLLFFLCPTFPTLVTVKTHSSPACPRQGFFVLSYPSRLRFKKAAKNLWLQQLISIKICQVSEHLIHSHAEFISKIIKKPPSLTSHSLSPVVSSLLLHFCLLLLLWSRAGQQKAQRVLSTLYLITRHVTPTLCKR